MNPIKKIQACAGLPGSSIEWKCRFHEVGCSRCGFRGSCMWNLDDGRATDGACGETIADKGIDIADMLPSTDGRIMYDDRRSVEACRE